MEMIDESKVRIVSFKTRGGAQAIRMLLIAIGVEYEDVFISYKTGIPSDIKKQYNLDFG